MKIFNTLIFSSFILIISIAAFFKPLYNWDILGYTACALSYEIKSPEAIHKKTYSLAQGMIPAHIFATIISRDIPLRKRTASDPEFFYEQLFAFKVKPLYSMFMFLISRLGIPLIQASYVVSVFSVIILAFFIFQWLTRYSSGYLAGFFSILVALSARLPYLARLSTPDAFSSALVVAAFYFLLEKNFVKLSCSLFLISILARADNIILVFMVFAYLGTRAPEQYALKKRTTVTLCLVAIMTGIGVLLSARTGLWLNICQNVFLGLNTDVYARTVFSPGEYAISFFLGLARPMWDIPFSSNTYAFLALGLLFFILDGNNYSRHCVARDIIGLCMLSIFIHFIFYPQLLDRLFTPQYILIIMMALKYLRYKQE